MMNEELKPCPFCGGEAAIKEYNDGSGGVYCTGCKFEPLMHASYHCQEDKPKAIKEWNARTPDIDIPTDRLQEIIQAEKDGRLVVLPCKAGDAVYFAYSGCEKISDAKVSGFWIADKWIQLQLANGSTFTCWDGPNKYFGKTVFLTEEEAEAALKEAKE